MATFKQYSQPLNDASEAFSIESFAATEIKVRVDGVLKTAGTGTGAGYQGAADLTDYGSGVLGMTQADVSASTSPEAQWSSGGGDPNAPTMSIDPTTTPLTDWQMGGDYAEAEPEPAYDPLAGLPAYTQLSQQGAGETPYIQQMPLIKGTGKGPG